MRKIFVILLIISPLFLFGQLRKTKFIMTDNTIHKGKIIEQSESEIKIISKRFKIITLSKSEISTPTQSEFDLLDFITVIKSKDGGSYQGVVVEEDDTKITLEIASKTRISIDKSAIIFRKNIHKKYINAKRIVSIITKDKALYQGKVIEKQDDYIILELALGQRKKINTNEIGQYSEQIISRSRKATIANTIIGTILMMNIIGYY